MKNVGLMLGVLVGMMMAMGVQRAGAQQVSVAFGKKKTSLIYYGTAISATDGYAALATDTIAVVRGALDVSRSDSLSVSLNIPSGTFPGNVAQYQWLDDDRRAIVLTAVRVDGTSQSVQVIVRAQLVNVGARSDTLTVTTYALDRELLPAMDSIVAARDRRIAELVADTLRLYQRLLREEHDTIWLHDTLHQDTTWLRDTFYHHDTVPSNTVYVYRDTIIEYDTVYEDVILPSGDTIWVEDTIHLVGPTVYDTVHLSVYDTIYVDTVVPVLVEWIRVYVDDSDVGDDIVFSYDEVIVQDGVATNMEPGRMFSVYNFAGVRLLTDVPTGTIYVLASKVPSDAWYILITTRRDADGKDRLIATKFRL